jgi:hypothetical protein
LFLSHTHGPHSPVLNLRSSFDSDVFDDWPKANDMAASVYVVLTVDALSSHVSMVDNLRCLSLVQVARLADGPVCERLRQKSLGDGKLRCLVLYEENRRKQRLMLSVLLQHPCRVVVCFPPLIMIRMSGKLCTLVLSRRASLTLPNM